MKEVEEQYNKLKVGRGIFSTQFPELGKGKKFSTGKQTGKEIQTFRYSKTGRKERKNHKNGGKRKKYRENLGIHENGGIVSKKKTR